MTWLWIALGGALGSISRHGVSLALARFDSFPASTLAANAAGSLLIGFAAGYWEVDQRKSAFALFLITGFCGGFTTFSTFSLQTLELIQNNEWMKAGSNIVASVILCLAFTAAGLWCSHAVIRGTP